MKPALLLPLVLLAGCDLGVVGPGDPNPRPPDPAGMTIVGPRAYNLLVGDTLTYRAFAYWLRDPCTDPFAPCWFPLQRVPLDSPVTWAVSGAAASVAAGLVTARTPGTATVRATAAGFTDTVRVTVVSRFQTLSAVAAGAGRTCSLTPSGQPYCWGGGSCFVFCDYTPDAAGLLPAAVPSAPPLTQLAAGAGVACGVTSTGAGLCWGSGPLGVSGTRYSPTPVTIAGGHAWQRLAVGTGIPFVFSVSEFTCGLRTDSTAWCWGANGEGQLGRDTVPNTCFAGYAYPCAFEPVAVQAGTRFVALTTGGAHACGLTASGTALCWGANGRGQLGDGTTTSRAAPAPVGGGLTLSALAAGIEHTCGIAGTNVYCLGTNQAFQLGGPAPDTLPHPDPVLVPAVTAATRLAAGDRTCALIVGGQVRCWGATPTPVTLAVPAPVTDLAVGVGHACVTTADGRARCWGYNGAGQLGAWTPTGSSAIPVAVAGPVP